MGEPAKTPDVSGEVALARGAQPAWAARALRERLRLVKRLRREIASHVHEFVEAIDAARPRVPGETVASEILPLAEACRFLERCAPRILRPRRHRTRWFPLSLGGIELEIRREPFGVVLIIGPSNYPLLLTGVQMIQALVVGNAVVVKPGRGGLAAMRVLTKRMEDVGFDMGVCRVLDESSASAREAATAGVDKVIVTGSAATGRAVLQDLAPRLVPATLELSGCDAVFVCEDADLDLVVKALGFGLRLNAGATCIGPHRVFVPRPLAAELEKRLAEEAGRIGPCEVERTVAERVKVLVDEAVASGARLVTGEIRPGERFRPVVLADASAHIRLLSEDLFSPVLALVPVESMEEALALSGRCPYALGASVFGSERTARGLAAKVRAGGVVVNDMIAPTAHPRAPFGGRSQSGYGVTRGEEGLLELTTVKVIAVRHGKLRPHFVEPAPDNETLARNLLLASHGRTLRTRLRAFFAVVRDFMSRKPGAGPAEGDTRQDGP